MVRRAFRLPILTGAIGLMIFAHTLLDAQAWDRRREVHRDLDQLERANEKLEQSIVMQRRTVAGLRHHSEVIARAIRHELNFVDSDDIIFEIAKSRAGSLD